MKNITLDKWVLPIVLLVIYSGLLLRTAWVSDDAYITFRSIENLVSGYGPTFNIAERVQTFTHPLWFFIQSGLYYLSFRVPGLNNWARLFYVNSTLSIICSVLAVLIAVFCVARTNKGRVILLLVLCLSKAFLDYSTSGLENPLTHFLLAVFLWIYLDMEPSEGKFGLLMLAAALSGVNRLDAFLLYLPILLDTFVRVKSKKRALGFAFLGLLPLLLWQLFSLFYYGMPFPNTAYAKINTGISKFSLFSQGLKYYANSITNDPVTLPIILAGIAIPWFQKKRRYLGLSAGLLLYLVYIVYIGGDFMSGRFFSVVVFGAAMMLSRLNFSLRVFTWCAGIIILLGILVPSSNLRSEWDYGSEEFDLYKDANGISDERAVYYHQTGLLKPGRTAPFPGSVYAGARWVVDDEPAELMIVGPLGIRGYQAGPNVHMIDRNGLASPLMPRLPLEDYTSWRIGHFRHVIPEGYPETLVTGENLIRDQDLKAYYDVLHYITAGDLSDPDRLVEIWNFNVGIYDHYLERFIENLQE